MNPIVERYHKQLENEARQIRIESGIEKPMENIKVSNKLSKPSKAINKNPIKLSSKPIKVKEILKKNKMIVKIKEQDVQNVLDDDNRFFKGEMDKVKKSMFFE